MESEISPSVNPQCESARGAFGMSPAHALIPRERFCALTHGGAIMAASAFAGSRESPPTVELSALDGAKGLIAEACP